MGWASGIRRAEVFEEAHARPQLARLHPERGQPAAHGGDEAEVAVHRPDHGGHLVHEDPEQSACRFRPRRARPVCLSMGSSAKSYARRTSGFQEQRPRLGHLLDGVPDAFAAESGRLDAAVGKVVDAQGRGVVDDHAADLERLERREDRARCRA